jgi:hypothetical protein
MPSTSAQEDFISPFLSSAEDREFRKSDSDSDQGEEEHETPLQLSD